MQLAQSLPAYGFDIGLSLLYRRDTAGPAIHPLITQVRQAGLGATQLEDTAKFSPQVVLHIREQLQRGRYHLVHTHDYKSNLAAGMAARWADVPRVATVHLHTRDTLSLRVYRLLDLAVLRFFPRIIVVSSYLRQELVGAGLPEQRIVTIHNAVDVEALVKGATPDEAAVRRRRLGIQPNQPVVTLIGRLSPQKGLDTFLESAGQVSQTFPDTRFLIIGEGPLREELQRKAAILGLSERVYFLGYQAEVLPLIALSDVISMPSTAEGLPFVLLESLALARPIVATRVGGIPEIVVDGETGLLVPPHDPAALADAVLRLLSNPAEAARLGEQGRWRVQREFSLTEMAWRTAEVYRQVLAART